MRNSFIIAGRELKERLGSRNFILFSILGPTVVLSLLYLLFAYGGKTSVKWNVLVSDKGGVLENKMLPREDSTIRYSFIQDYVEVEDFAEGKKFQKFDALIEINEKVLSNKVGFVFYRNIPSSNLEKRLQYQVERRLEEIMVKEFTTLTPLDFRKIKQPLNLSFRNVYDPYDTSSDKKGWVGLFLGTLIFVFISLFAMTLMRGVTREKSNRIVEILLAAVRPIELMFGKIIGIGMSAMIQFGIWLTIITIGLMWMRSSLFPNYVDTGIRAEMSQTSPENSSLEPAFEYNEFVDLVYERVQFTPMLGAFLACFIGGYFFYAAFFASVGASTGSESDGQQFVIPLILLLCFGIYGGYYALENPEAELTTWLHYLPFTSPSVLVVKLAQGYADGQGYQFYLSFLILILSGILMLSLSARIYKNGLLQFGHRLKLKHLIRWIKG